ncbi:winged helix-turn-helix domain-containing protein [Leclercia pneumoniae]|uniref:winged helix-turn-helix domain-containing protein n=1 Tax=Leclercia pneumoniae TaxID=2815358 RepID=UPI003BF51743
MIYQPYAFLIDNVIHIDIKKGCIFRIDSVDKNNELSLGILYLNDTMMSLLSYLLIHAQKRYITKEEVLIKVWDENNLSSSGTRLWQVFTTLKQKLALLHLPENLIKYEKRKGYIIKHDNILTLYYKETENSQLTVSAVKQRRASTFISLHQ